MKRTKSSTATAVVERKNHLALAPEVELAELGIIADESESKEEPENCTRDFDGLPSAVSIFMRSMGRIPLLGGTEEIELARQIKEGNAQAKHKMVLSNLRLVVSNAKKFEGRGMPFEDRIQEGCIGLMRAADKFDEKRGCKFSTHATNWIKQGIQRNIVDKERPVRIPVYTDTQVQKLRKVAHEFLVKNERNPSIIELAAAMKLKPEKVSELLEVIRDYFNIQSLDVEIQNADDNDATTLESRISAPKTYQPEEVMTKLEMSQHVEALLGELLPLERRLLELHFGFVDETSHTLKQLEQTEEFRGMHVQEIYSEAMRKLQIFVSRNSLGIELKDMIGI